MAGAADVAEHAYRAMLSGDVLSIHGALNWLMMESLRIAPRALVRTLAADLNRT